MRAKDCGAQTSTFVRWCRFNLVGGVGIAVQFAALFVLRSLLHFDYLFATAVAVEAAVVHNFVWHEQFTWADRVQARLPERESKTKALDVTLSKIPLLAKEARSGAPGSTVRFVRFNLTNGAVSILGNMALMRVMVGEGHMNYLLANGIAIALCSVANFLVSEEWVFQG